MLSHWCGISAQWHISTPSLGVRGETTHFRETHLCVSDWGRWLPRHPGTKSFPRRHTRPAEDSRATPGSSEHQTWDLPYGWHVLYPGSMSRVYGQGTCMSVITTAHPSPLPKGCCFLGCRKLLCSHLSTVHWNRGDPAKSWATAATVSPSLPPG